MLTECTTYSHSHRNFISHWQWRSVRLHDQRKYHGLSKIL